MSRAAGLSPLGTARLARAGGQEPGTVTLSDQAELDLLAWLRPICARLHAHFNLPEEIAYLAWELGRWQPGLDGSERRSVILLILAALVQSSQGSTRLDLAEQLALLIQQLTGCESAEAQQERDSVQSKISSGRLSVIAGTGAAEFKPLIVAGGHVYLQRMLHLEDQLVAAIRFRRAAPVLTWPRPNITSAMRDVLDRPAIGAAGPIALTEEQREAIRAGVENSLTIISGGPGTGKTTVVVSLLRVLHRLGVPCEDFALAAPTGRAARRLGNAVRTGCQQIADPAPADLDLAEVADPRTLHRLLGYSPATGTFRFHQNNRLGERVVIVDESSMVDLALMERLLRCLREDGRLILLGDAHQLPSVEAGSVLRDLLAAESLGPRAAGRGVLLSQSHRMRAEDVDGRNLLAVARAIDQGQMPDFVSVRTSDSAVIERGSPSELTFHGVEFIPALEGPRVLDNFLDHWINKARSSTPDLDALVAHEYAIAEGTFPESDEARLRALFQHLEQSCILCVSRVLPAGSDRINALLHARFAHEKGFDCDDNELVAGEPVMMQVNDYQRMIFNGDQGVVLKVVDRGWPLPMAVFRRPDGFVAFHLDPLRHSLERSYAITVHKAQGSEFDRVAVILPDRDLPINTREVLYTALTRARRSAVFFGARAILAVAISRTLGRNSGVAEKLAAGS
jgi:exodeoxyribonuclease V alpha subunit